MPVPIDWPPTLKDIIQAQREALGLSLPVPPLTEELKILDEQVKEGRMRLEEKWTTLTNAAGDGGFLFPPGFPSHIIEELNKADANEPTR